MPLVLAEKLLVDSPCCEGWSVDVELALKFANGFAAGGAGETPGRLRDFVSRILQNKSVSNHCEVSESQVSQVYCGGK